MWRFRNQNDGEETTFEEWTSIKKATSHDQWLVAQSKLKLAVGCYPTSYFPKLKPREPDRERAEEALAADFALETADLW